MKDLKGAVKIVGMALLAAAVVNELRKPSQERTWRGRLYFSVPYDLTFPNMERIREAYWNPNDDHIFTDRVLGVGWAINMYALLKKVGLIS